MTWEELDWIALDRLRERGEPWHVEERDRPRTAQKAAHLIEITHGLQPVAACSRAQWQQWQVVSQPAQDLALRAWLDQHQVQAVVVRPDRYILGMANTSAQLDALSQQWFHSA